MWTLLAADRLLSTFVYHVVLSVLLTVLYSNFPMDSLSVGALVCPVHCGKTADRIRMPFGIICWTGPGMRHLVGLVDRSTGRGTFGGEFGARYCNQWGLTFTATRPSSQITLGRLVQFVFIIEHPL